MTTPSWYPDPPYTANAEDREAAWLSTSGDGLPALLASAGGPFEIVQAYWPGSKLRTQATSLYVTRGNMNDPKVAAQRIRPAYAFQLKIVWPIRAVNMIAETEQRHLAGAVELIRARVDGPLGDKSHGGRFLSVAQVPERQPFTVDWEDPEQTIQQSKSLRVRIVYYADDLEINN